MRPESGEHDRKRSDHQETVAELRKVARSGGGIEPLMEMAVRKVAKTLDVDFCKVLELQPPGDSLLVRAGVGWKEGYVGMATVGTEDTQAAYTLRVGRPVRVEDLRREERFREHSVLRDHGVLSGVTVVLQGATRPYGVLGAHSAEVRLFTTEESHFVQSVANVLGTAIERHRAESGRELLMRRLSAERSRLEAVLQNLPVGVIIADAPSGRLVMGNEAVERIWRMPFLPADSPDGYEVYRGRHPDGSAMDGHEWPLSRAIQGETVSGEELHFERGDGTLGVILASAAPVRDEDGEIVAGVVVFDDITERTESDTALRESRAQLRALAEELDARVQARTRQVRSLASSLALAEQRERHRVAQILHDDLQQLLYAAQVQLHMAERATDGTESSAREHFVGAGNMIKRAVGVARTLTIDLSPPVLRDEGLFEALQWLATQMRDEHGLTVEVDSKATPTVGKEELRVLIFQLLRELLLNVVKHAKVDRARVSLHAEGEWLTIAVEDEGVGFDPEEVQSGPSQDGLGLISMDERVGLFGGRLELQSTPGRGTRAMIVIPVADA